VRRRRHFGPEGLFSIQKQHVKAFFMKELFTKLAGSKFSIVFLIGFVALLYIILVKAVLPFTLDILKSDLFFEKPKEEGEQLGKIEHKTPRTGFALAQCKDAAKNEGNFPANAEFMDDKYEAWALGNRQYLIRSIVRVNDPAKGQTEKPYACNIRMVGDDESQAESWTVLGVDFNAVSEGN
jgi:hypothetical protein